MYSALSFLHLFLSLVTMVSSPPMGRNRQVSFSLCCGHVLSCLVGKSPACVQDAYSDGGLLPYVLVFSGIYTKFAVLTVQKSMQSQKHLTLVFTFGKLS